MPAAPFWTPEQDADLIRIINGGASATKAGKHFGRTRSSIIGRVHRLQARGEKVQFKGSEERRARRAEASKAPAWTEGEIGTLRWCVAQKKTLAEAAEIIGRTPASVRLRAWKVNLRFVVKATPKTRLAVRKVEAIAGAGAPPPASASAPIPLRLTLAELESSQCKFVVSGRGAEALFCGSATGNILSHWCPYHRGIVYQRRGAA